MAQKLNVNTSIVDYLKSIGKDSSFSARAQMAVDFGIVKNIKDYKGTAEQNTSLLKKAKATYSSTSATNTTPKADTNNKQADKPKADNKAKASTKTDDSTLLRDNVDTKVTTGTDTTATDWADLYSQIVQDVIPGGDFTYEEAPLLDTISRPEFRTSADLAALTGLNYDYNTIYDILMRSVDAGFDARYAEQDAIDSEYYTKAAAAQSALAETLAQQQSQAILTGTNRGMQAANALSSVLGVSQQFAGGAGELAQQRAQIAKEYAQAQAQAGVNAMNQSTDVAKYLADIAKNIYSADASMYVGQLDYNAAANAANAQLGAQRMAAQASLAGNLADIMNSYYSGQISLEQARIAANAQIQSAKVYGLDAAAINAASQEAVANINKEASNYTADKNYEASKYVADRNYDATINAANINKESYIGTAAEQTKQQVAGLLGGIASGVSSNMMSPEEGIAQLDALRAQGLIDDTTYNAMIKTFPAIAKPTDESSKTNTNNTAANKQGATKSPSTSSGILDNISKGAGKILDRLILSPEAYYYKHPEDIDSKLPDHWTFPSPYLVKPKKYSNIISQ